MVNQNPWEVFDLWIETVTHLFLCFTLHGHVNTHFSACNLLSVGSESSQMISGLLYPPEIYPASPEPGDQTCHTQDWDHCRTFKSSHCQMSRQLHAAVVLSLLKWLREDDKESPWLNVNTYQVCWILYSRIIHFKLNVIRLTQNFPSGLV